MPPEINVVEKGFLTEMTVTAAERRTDLKWGPSVLIGLRRFWHNLVG